MDEQAMIVTPAMRTKIEELVELVVGCLPGYKIADITFGVTMTVDVPGEDRSTRRVLLRHPSRSHHGTEARRTSSPRPEL